MSPSRPNGVVNFFVVNAYRVVSEFVVISGKLFREHWSTFSLTFTTRLTEVVNTLEKNISGMSAKNSESHGRLWEKCGEHDELLNRHETRLLLLERGEEKKPGQQGCPGG